MNMKFESYLYCNNYYQYDCYNCRNIVGVNVLCICGIYCTSDRDASSVVLLQVSSFPLYIFPDQFQRVSVHKRHPSCADCITINMDDMDYLSRGWNSFFGHVDQLPNTLVETPVFLS